MMESLINLFLYYKIIHLCLQHNMVVHQQSTALPCPPRFNISGARYATDPQNDLAPELCSKTPSLDKPKSVNKAYPSASNTILSGLRSLNTISLLCKSSSAFLQKTAFPSTNAHSNHHQDNNQGSEIIYRLFKKHIAILL